MPFVIMNAAGVSLTRMSPYIVRVSYTLWQIVTPLAPMGGEAGLEASGYIAVPDFVPGHESEAAFTKAFTEAGGRSSARCAIPLMQSRLRAVSSRASRT